MRHDAYSPRVPWQILFHQEVVGWLHQLNPKEKLSVDLAVEALREKGPDSRFKEHLTSMHRDLS